MLTANYPVRKHYKVQCHVPLVMRNGLDKLPGMGNPRTGAGQQRKRTVIKPFAASQTAAFGVEGQAGNQSEIYLRRRQLGCIR